MLKVPFKQVDVFTTKPFHGNPVAVILEAQHLTTPQMQQIARWTNLSETTFVSPPQHNDADYSVRIFTPTTELPFAGHPTIGTAYALLESQRIVEKQGKLHQQCGIGIVNLNVTRDTQHAPLIGFLLPEAHYQPLTALECQQLEQALGAKLDLSLPPLLIDVGPRWIVAHLSEEVNAVLNVQPDYAKLIQHNKKLNATGVCIYGCYSNNTVADLEVRAFAPCCGVNEDPVCGSGNGSVAVFLRHYHLVNENKKVKVSQGQCVARQGELYLDWRNQDIFIIGSAVTCIDGVIRLD